VYQNLNGEATMRIMSFREGVERYLQRTQKAAWPEARVVNG
jgi:hypothetical protein